MELWIRSQDKMNLVKVNQININYQNNNQIIANYIPDFVGTQGEYYEYLGTYKSKERAIEVLDEIQNILKPQLIIKDSGKIIGSFEDTIVREGATYELKELSTYVYQLPKD